MEIAFVVKPESDFYKTYFDSKREREKFHRFALLFFDKHELNVDKFCVSHVLRIRTTDDIRQKYGNQIRKNLDQNGFIVFKTNSRLQKAWLEEVCGRIDFNLAEAIKFWYLPYIMCGRYSLWDKDGTIYGMLVSNTSDIKIDEKIFTPIKMSKYYMAVEAYENKVV